MYIMCICMYMYIFMCNLFSIINYISVCHIINFILYCIHSYTYTSIIPWDIVLLYLYLFI